MRLGELVAEDSSDDLRGQTEKACNSESARATSGSADAQPRTFRNLKSPGVLVSKCGNKLRRLTAAVTCMGQLGE